MAETLHASAATVEVHRFPDGEVRVRLTGAVTGEDVVFLAALAVGAPVLVDDVISSGRTMAAPRERSERRLAAAGLHAALEHFTTLQHGSRG